MSHKSEAYDLLFNIAHDMGYDKEKIDNIHNTLSVNYISVC